MGKNKNQHSFSQRWAIWTVYGMKCFKCSKPLNFLDCQIVRLLPESGNKALLASLIQEHGLAGDFSAKGDENLLPACRACRKTSPDALFKSAALARNWFKLIRLNAEKALAKIKLIDSEPMLESGLKQLIEKLEQGQLSPEDAEKILKPFLESSEGKSRSPIELRLSDAICYRFSETELVRVPLSELRYQKFVDGMVESGDWKRKSVERIQEGPGFGEGGLRRRKGGA